jgi:GNAT superfamily N-acetyltransferase
VSWAIERLTTRHDREAFSCGYEQLDRYLKQQAGQDARRHVAATLVAVPEPGHGHICGYYTLSAFGVDASELPPEMARKFPRYSRLPAALLGRLAVDLQERGRGLGARLLMDALHRAYLQSGENLAVAFVIVDAIDAEAASFYRHFHFIPFDDRPERLFLPMQTAARLFDGR